jgi:hypothetical protein
VVETLTAGQCSAVIDGLKKWAKWQNN